MIRFPALAFATAIALLSAPLHADMLDGANDPAFRTALTTLLVTDDPAAVATLRDLAEAGNAAALVTLPLALQWVPPQGNLKEKNAQRQVGGITAQVAAAEAHGATAIWNTGAVDNSMELPDRAASLAALGEPEKAAYLLALWANQSGGTGDLPPTLFTDAPAWIGGAALIYRMGFGRSVSFDDQDLLLGLIRQDSPAAWMAIAQLTEGWDKTLADLGDPLVKAGIPATTSEARLADARAIAAVSAVSRREIPVTPDTATRARAALTGRLEFAPLERLCRAHCPASLASCEAAVLAYPGLPFGNFELEQPFRAVLSPDDFAASDRGLAALIPLRQNPAAVADRATAEGLDACYATLLARRDTLRFGP